MGTTNGDSVHALILPRVCFDAEVADQVLRITQLRGPESGCHFETRRESPEHCATTDCVSSIRAPA